MCIFVWIVDSLDVYELYATTLLIKHDSKVVRSKCSKVIVQIIKKLFVIFSNKLDHGKIKSLMKVKLI